jgi:hypothetical protein
MGGLRAGWLPKDTLGRFDARCRTAQPHADCRSLFPTQSIGAIRHIGDLEGRLDPTLFLRVHRSYIVNLTLVNEFVREGGRITLRMKGEPCGESPVEIPVSRSSTSTLLEQLGLIGVPQINP